MPLMSAARLSLKEVPKLTTSSSFSPMSSALRGSSLDGVAGVAAEVVRVGVLRPPPVPSGRRSGRPRRPWRPRTGRRCRRCAPAHRWRRSNRRQFFAATSSVSPSSAVSSVLSASLSLAEVLCGGAVGGGGGAAAAGQQGGRQCQSGGDGGRSFPVDPSHVFCFLSVFKTGFPRHGSRVHPNKPNKKRGLLRAERQHKKTPYFSRFFAVQPIPRDLEPCAPVPGSGQVSWLKVQRPPPPSQTMPSDRCRCTLAAGSLITVTRSCGICTRFPFTLFCAANCRAKRHLLSYSVLRGTV